MDFQKYIDRLDQDRRDSEQRQIAMEQRLTKSYNQLEQRLERTTEESRAAFARMEDKIDGLKLWIIAVCLATIIGIATMVFTVVAV